MAAKVTRLSEAKKYTAPGHTETVHTMWLQHKSMDCPAPYWMGCSYYLPGARAEWGTSPLDKIYVVLEGELTILRCLNCGAVRDSRMDVQRTRPVREKRKEPRQTTGLRRHSLLVR